MTDSTNKTVIATDTNHYFWQKLSNDIKHWGQQLGFDQVVISDTDPNEHAHHLANWLSNGYHGTMSWMAERQALREDPAQLVPHTIRVISARMNYFPPDDAPVKVLKNAKSAYISRYALGRDYHKLIRKRLAQLGKKSLWHCQVI